VALSPIDLLTAVISAGLLHAAAVAIIAFGTGSDVYL
jgi:hypothetical protein